ncbi:toll/interleukin-1 receptor domain-containing protein [Nocardia gamkensis]|uniref:toll/interleukin-1 receptor domain-containing protein n=1 Tax=Nocardia gamkensis TaxID=352869 RepID=UPI0033D9B9D6
MTASGAPHVFISYVQEDKTHVDHLCTILAAAQIPFWRDRNSLGPGDSWKMKIRDAIRSNSAVFLACFSEQSLAKKKSYMNEEITIAVEEFRTMSPGHNWLIPIRFDDIAIPEWDLGAGRTFYDLNYVDLFGENRDANMVTLAMTLVRAVGGDTVDPTTVSASVDEATLAERRVMLRRLTKEMLLEPSRAIELNDLVSDEVGRIIGEMQDTDRFPVTLVSGSNHEQLATIASIAKDYRELVGPFCDSLQVAARWGATNDLTPWTDGLRAIYNEADKPLSGNTILIKLRKIPTVIATFTAALACTGSKRWDNFKTLLVDNEVNYGSRGKKAFLDANSLWEPFENVPKLGLNIIARSTIQRETPLDSLSWIEKNNFSYRTPIAEWLLATLRSTFNDQFRDERTYEAEFDRAEVFLGIVSQDLANVAAGQDPARAWLRRSLWFGRVMWRFRSHHNPVDEFSTELTNLGSNWPPLRANLFDSDSDRAGQAISEYDEQLRKSPFL